jgi:lipoprotein-anchoring transpeptidase ErfK/SrfK
MSRSSLLGLCVAAILSLAVPAAAAAAPAPPAIATPRQSALVDSTFTIAGRVAADVTALRVSGAESATVLLGAADSEGATFTAEVTVAYGRNVLHVAASDGSTWSDATALTVWYLGQTTAGGTFVLVDKSDFMLYAIRDRVVAAAYPIAIGMRGTPTPTGKRYIGRPVHAPNRVWGPFRMRLYRKVPVRVAYRVWVGGRRVTRHRTVLKFVGTSYYIHGTNAPDSIGTPASHGCIRLWNSNLRVFKTLTHNYEFTLIRP